MTLFLLLLLVAVALGIIGVAAQGLLYLLFIGIALLIVSLVGFGWRGGRRHRRPAR